VFFQKGIKVLSPPSLRKFDMFMCKIEGILKSSYIHQTDILFRRTKNTQIILLGRIKRAGYLLQRVAVNF